MSVSGGKTGDPSFFKSIFTTVQTSRQARVYRVDSLTIDDEGYVDDDARHVETCDWLFGVDSVMTIT